MSAARCETGWGGEVMVRGVAALTRPTPPRPFLAKRSTLPLQGRVAHSHPVHRYRNLGAVLDGLVDHAIALGEFEQEIELVLRRVGIDVEAQANLGEADR